MEEHPDTNDALRALDRDVAPPDRLEERVRRSLRSRGLLRGRRSPVWHYVARTAAAVALFFAGYLTGRIRQDEPASPIAAGRYALMLYEDSTFDASRPELELVAEYTAWAADLREQGRLETGERLASAEVLLERQAGTIVASSRRAAGEIGALAGLFVIRATSEAEALRIARTCPHLAYGGRVAVREILGR
jgi:hypothetical protein